MASFAGAFAASHGPLLVREWDALPPGEKSRVKNAFEELGRRLNSIFLRDADGRRPLYGGTEKFQTDPLWRDYVQFFEYFHGDNGAGLGASHQTGWTGIVARTMQMFATLTPRQIRDVGIRSTVQRDYEDPARTRPEQRPAQ